MGARGKKGTSNYNLRSSHLKKRGPGQKGNCFWAGAHHSKAIEEKSQRHHTFQVQNEKSERLPQVTEKKTRGTEGRRERRSASECRKKPQGTSDLDRIHRVGRDCVRKQRVGLCKKNGKVGR